MFKHISQLLFISLLFSASAEASLINFKHYSRQETSEVIKSNNLEWRIWDQQEWGSSLKKQIADFSLSGWRLATNAEMTTLLNDFFADPDSLLTFTEADYFERLQQGHLPDLMGSTTDPHSVFLQLFGYETQDRFENNPDPEQSVWALFGDDQDNDGLYKTISVFDEHFRSSPWGPMMSYGKLVISSDNISLDSRGPRLALVRDIKHEIPTGSSFSLFCLACVMLFFRAVGKQRLNF